MTVMDSRESFVARRVKLIRSIHSGDRAAPARLDALITEMQHVLGVADPDTLATLLEYVEMQDLEGRVMSIWRTLDEYLTAFDSVFGVDGPLAARAHFASVIQGVHTLTWSFSFGDVAAEDPESASRTTTAEILQERKMRRDRVVQGFGPSVVQLARARGMKGGLSQVVTQASDCVTHLIEGELDDAALSLSQIPATGSSGESLAWLIDPLALSISLCREAESSEPPLDVSEVCEGLEHMADSVADDPEWAEFFEEHEVGLLLAQLVNAGMAEPTEEGMSLILRAWDVAVADLEA